jgi:hypothetical protein
MGFFKLVFIPLWMACAITASASPITWEMLVAGSGGSIDDDGMHARLGVDASCLCGAGSDGVADGLSLQELEVLRYGVVLRDYLIVAAPPTAGDPDQRFYFLPRSEPVTQTASNDSMKVAFDPCVRFSVHFREEFAPGGGYSRMYFVRSVYAKEPAGSPRELSNDARERLENEFQAIRFLRGCGAEWDRQRMRVLVSGPMEAVYAIPQGEVVAYMLDRRGQNTLDGNELSAYLPPEPEAERCVVYATPGEERLRLWYQRAVATAHSRSTPSVPVLHLPMSPKGLRGACPTVPLHRATDIVVRAVEEFVMRSARIHCVVLHVANEGATPSVLGDRLEQDAVAAALARARDDLQRAMASQGPIPSDTKQLAVKKTARTVNAVQPHDTHTNSEFVLTSACDSDVAVTDDAIYAKFKRMWPDAHARTVLVADVADQYHRQQRSLGLDLTLDKAVAEVCRLAGLASTQAPPPKTLTYQDFCRFTLAVAKQ